jgi:DNA-binding CsgD family transcriptional regulator
MARSAAPASGKPAQAWHSLAPHQRDLLRKAFESPTRIAQALGISRASVYRHVGADSQAAQ